MPKNLVNLDALIRREDFDVTADVSQSSPQLTTTVRITDLEQGSILYHALRKPDFQRETADWEPEKVADLIQSFVEGDLIPSVILWRSKSGNIFINDGAHRLSALIAWVHDDYGDKNTSIQFFQNFISPEQKKAADKTRMLVKNAIGSYQELRVAAMNPDTSTPKRVLVGKNLAVMAISVQWLVGDAAKAESSYFKINQKATLIDPTELDMIKARRKPNTLATRALTRAGTGHKYWSAFPKSVQDEIEKTAHEIYESLFKPPIETPIRTLDLPIAGRGYSADSVKLVFDLVNLINGISPEMWKEEPKKLRGNGATARKNILPDDQDGLATLNYLKAVKKIASRISGLDPHSLGLDPVVYFYGATGRFLPTAFLAVVAFVRELESKNAFTEFTKARYRFEEFLLKYRHFVNQIHHAVYGSDQRLQAMLLMYHLLLSGITDGKTDEEIIKQMQTLSELKSIKEITDEDKQYGRDFSTATKSAVYLRQAVEQGLRCNICNARTHFKSISFDHEIRKDDGGIGSPGNAQMTHPYCNSGYKEMLHAKGTSHEKAK